MSSLINFSKKIQIKSLSFRLKNSGGRSEGTIIAPRRGSLHRRIYRYIDFNRIFLPSYKALVLRTIHDSNRTASLSLICFPVGLLTYILKPAKINDFIINLTKTTPNLGDSSLLKNFSSGSIIYNINGKIARSAGCSALLIRQEDNQALLKLKSGELRFFNSVNIASLGSASNENHFLKEIEKAGRQRYLGNRPRTRPSSMNPVDHPLGGRTRGGSFPKNKKGVITLNRPTVKDQNPNILYTKRQLKILFK